MASLTSIQQKQEREIYSAFMTAIREVKDQAVISELANLINVGDINGVIDLLQLSPATYEKLEESIRTTYAIGGATGASQLGRIPTPKGTLVLRFNTRAPAAEKWLSELSSTRIVEISNETRQVVRSLLTQGIEAGRGPRSVALDLVGRIDPVSKSRVGGAIGLTDAQSQWAIEARRELENLDPNYLTRKLRDKRLDGAFKKAIESGTPMPASQIDAAVSRLQARTLRYRGQNIARTESLSALSEGQNASIQQALDVAELDEEFTTKKWQSSGKVEERHEHVAVESAYPDGIKFNESFNVGGVMMRWPRAPEGGAKNVINCFLPTTPISVHNLKSAIRREYVGNVFKLSAGSGVDLTVTPNHPILTSRGWVAACDVVKGDKLINCSRAGHDIGLEPDKANRNTTAEQLYNAAESLGSSDRVVSSVVNLHGEIPAQDVDIVSVHSSLTDTLNSTTAEFFDYFTLADTDVSLVGLVYDRIVSSCEVRSTNCSDSSVSLSSSRPSFVGRGHGSTPNITLGNCRPDYSKVEQAGVYKTPIHSNFLGHGIDSPSTIKKVLNLLMVTASFIKMPFTAGGTNEGRCLGLANRANFKVGKARSNKRLGLVDSLRNMRDWKVFHAENSVVKLFSGREMSIGGRSSIKNTHLNNSVSNPTDSEVLFSGDKVNGFAAKVGGFNVVEVDNIESFHYDGPVYNFETRSGLIVSGNTISHNCGCRLSTVVNFAGRAAKELRGF